MFVGGVDLSEGNLMANSEKGGGTWVSGAILIHFSSTSRLDRSTRFPKRFLVKHLSVKTPTRYVCRLFKAQH